MQNHFMPTRGKLILLAIGGGLAALLLFLTWPNREPSYQDKPLSYWIGRLVDTNSAKGLASKSEQQIVRDAIHHMGPNAISRLGNWASYDCPLRLRLLRILPHQLRRFMELHPIDQRYMIRAGRAAQALIVLGPEASSIFPQLGHVFTDGELFEGGTRALSILREIGEPAVPTLANAMTNKPSRMREVIVMNLGHMGPKALAAVPALKSLLDNPDPDLHRGVYIHRSNHRLPLHEYPSRHGWTLNSVRSLPHNLGRYEEPSPFPNPPTSSAISTCSAIHTLHHARMKARLAVALLALILLALAITFHRPPPPPPEPTFRRAHPSPMGPPQP